jgi:replicative DNA helicase
MGDNFKLADLDLEKTVLGHILGYGAYPMYQSVGLTESAFYREEHQTIYNAAVSLHKEAVTADIVTIRQKAPSLNAAYMAQLPDGVPRPRKENAGYICRRLLQLADARACYYSAIALHKALQDRPDDVTAAVTEHLSVLDGARQRYTGTADRYDADLQWTAFEESLARDQQRAFLGIDAIDSALGGIRRGEVCGIMARPGIGKTLFLGHMINTSVAQNINTTMFSLEMPVDQMVSRLARSVFQMGRYQLEDSAVAKQIDSTEYCRHFGPLSIIDTPALSMSDIEQRLRAEDDPQLVMIDHLGLIGGHRSQSTYDRVSSIAREVKELAKRTNTAVVLAIQVSREAGGDGSRELTLGSARDSGIVEEVMDYLVAIRRPERSTALSATQRIHYRDVLLFSILKNRHGEVGKETAVNVDTTALTLEADPNFRFDDALETIGRVRRNR